MIKKKRGGLLLNIYLLITIAMITFFTVYAFRYCVYDFLYENGYVKQESKKELDKRIRPLIKEKYMLLKNIPELDKALADELKDYDYEILTISDNHIIQNLFLSKGFLVYKDGWTYKKHMYYHFHKNRIEIICYPKLYKYFEFYNWICAVSAIIICLLFILGNKIEMKHHLMKKWTSKVFQSNKLFKLYRLSTELLIVNIFAFLIAGSLFAFLYVNRFSPLEYLKDSSFFREKTIEEMDRSAQLIQTEIRHLDIKKDNKKIEEIIKSMIPRYAKSILSDEDNLDNVYVAEEDIYNDFMHGIYDLLIVRRPFDYYYVLECDHKYATLSITYFPFIYYMQIYIIGIFIISFSYYLILTQKFIKRKIRAIQIIQEDASILSQGDWSHNFRYVGNDEIGALSNELRSMQQSFYENMENERKASLANRKLVTALSHDLRTPLTSLLGYLELIRYREGTILQKKEYLDRSLQKVEQIRCLSDKLFEYFLVYVKEESPELLKQPIENLLCYICENADFMLKDDVPIQLELEEANEGQALYNLEMMQRAIDNIFSNIHKYADRNHIIQIYGYRRETVYCLYFQNHIRKDDDKVERNCIGLKSVEKIMNMHNAKLQVQEENDSFMIELQLPLLVKE